MNIPNVRIADDPTRISNPDGCHLLDEFLECHLLNWNFNFAPCFYPFFVAFLMTAMNDALAIKWGIACSWSKSKCRRRLSPG